MSASAMVLLVLRALANAKMPITPIRRHDMSFLLSCHKWIICVCACRCVCVCVCMCVCVRACERAWDLIIFNLESNMRVALLNTTVPLNVFRFWKRWMQVVYIHCKKPHANILARTYTHTHTHKTYWQCYVIITDIESGVRHDLLTLSDRMNRPRRARFSLLKKMSS